MDIKDLSNASTVVIQTLKQILINHGVDISKLDMQLKANNGECLSDAVNLGELVDQVLVQLGIFKSMHETHVVVEKDHLLEVVGEIGRLFDGDPLLTLGVLLPIRDGIQAMTEAAEGSE